MKTPFRGLSLVCLGVGCVHGFFATAVPASNCLIESIEFIENSDQLNQGEIEFRGTDHFYIREAHTAPTQMNAFLFVHLEEIENGLPEVLIRPEPSNTLGKAELIWEKQAIDGSAALNQVYRLEGVDELNREYEVLRLSPRSGLAHEYSDSLITKLGIPVEGKVLRDALPLPLECDAAGGDTTRSCRYVYISPYTVELQEPSSILIESQAANGLGDIRWYHPSLGLSGDFLDLSEGDGFLYEASAPEGLIEIVMINESQEFVSCNEEGKLSQDFQIYFEPVKYDIHNNLSAEVALNDFDSGNWEAIALDGFETPLYQFSDQIEIMKGEGAGFHLGFLQINQTLQPLFKGEYEIEFDTSFEKIPDKYLPEFRIRIFTVNGLKQTVESYSFAMGEDTPSKVTMNWTSDGETPWKIAFDLLSFDEIQAGSVKLDNFKINRTSN